jgi:hypothetical protein
VSRNETTTDLLAQELRDLDVEIGNLTRSFSIPDVERMKSGIPSPFSGALEQKICQKYHRLNEIQNAFNAVH